MARNTRQQGNKSENAVMAEAEALGYATFAARGSRGPVDVLCFQNFKTHPSYWDGNGDSPADLVPIVAQIGTTNKPIAATLAELSAAPRPIGSLCLVARRHKHKTSKRISWTFHSNKGKYLSLKELLDDH